MSVALYERCYERRISGVDIVTAWFANLLAESRFLARYPQYTSLLASFEPMGTSEVDSMAVALHRPLDKLPIVRLYVNPAWFQKTPEFFPGILMHEIQHVVYGHIHDEKFHRVAQPQMMELAMELAANEGIVEPLPNPLRWQDFTELGITACQSTMQRYELLCRACDNGSLMFCTEDQLDAINPGWREQLSKSDSCQGGSRVIILPSRHSRLPQGTMPRVMPSMGMDDHRPGQGCGHGDSGLGDSLDRRHHDQHAETWMDHFGLGYPSSPKLIERWQLEIRSHLRGERGGGLDNATVRLRASKELPRELTWNAARKAQLVWPKILQMFLRLRRVPQPNYLRPNRRFPRRIGELPGRSRSARRPSLLVGIDTSASISSQLLGRINQEIQNLGRYANVTIAECDASIQRQYRLRSIEQVMGGGDTDFHPLFALADISGRSYDGILHFTDGKGLWPEKTPPLPALWVLSNLDAFDCPWGTVVRLPT